MFQREVQADLQYYYLKHETLLKFQFLVLNQNPTSTDFMCRFFYIYIWLAYSSYQCTKVNP